MITLIGMLQCTGRLSKKIFSSVLLASSFICVSLSFANADERPPNILFIGVDDLRPSIGAYGDKIAVTPNLDALANSSLQFNNAYVQMATCSPSRASLMSSQRPDTLQIFYSNAKTKLVQDAVRSELTLNGFFKSNGYETIGIGKVYHKPEDSTDGWSKPLFSLSHDSSHKATRGLLSREGYLSMSAWDEKHPGTNRPVTYEAADVGDEAYADGYNNRYAILELNRLSKQDKPFFMVMGYRKPHLPFACPKRHWDKYQRKQFTIDERQSAPAKSPKFAINNSGELRRYPYMPSGKTAFSQQDTISLNHGYYACVSYIDTLVGELLKELEDTGLADNTIVVFWGDHGYKLGEYGQFNKHTNYEIDTHVPLLVRMPKQKSGVKTKAIVETIDIFPTLVDLAGLAIPKSLAGQSFKNTIINQGDSFKKAAFQQFYRNHKGRSLMGYAVRSEHYRYVAWIDWSSGELVAQELYDHTQDPLETLNVADEKGYADIVAEHEKLRLRGYPPTLIEPEKAKTDFY